MDSSILRVKNTDKLGSLEFSYEMAQDILGMFPCFNKIDEGLIITYETGFANLDRCFFKSPWKNFYVEFEKIVCEKILVSGSSPHNFYVDLKILNKSGNIKTARYTFTGINLDKLATIINLINVYIERNNDLILLDLKLLEKYSFKHLSKECLFESINALEVEYYSDSITRVGKDNIYYEEAIIKLPDDKYICELVKKTFGNGGRLTEHGLRVEIDRSYGWGASSSRHSDKSVKANEYDSLKEKIKIFSIENYDSAIHNQYWQEYAKELMFEQYKGNS